MDRLAGVRACLAVTHLTDYLPRTIRVDGGSTVEPMGHMARLAGRLVLALLALVALAVAGSAAIGLQF
jgi:hypothetical protein